MAHLGPFRAFALYLFLAEDPNFEPSDVKTTIF
jgi:hypothetical protein